MKRNIVKVAIALLVGIVMLAACSSDKGPAELAIKAAEEAVNASKAEAAKYVPEELKSLEGALAAVKDKFAKKEYKAAIADAQALAGVMMAALHGLKTPRPTPAAYHAAASLLARVFARAIRAD